MEDRKFIIGIIIATVVILIGGMFIATRMGNAAEVSANPAVTVKAPETSFDWGTIAMDSGNAEHVFTITNTGTQPLKLSNVVTSCMCTTANLTYKDKTSPIFGMHSKSSYVMEVAPDDTAQLKVIFDPAFHGPSGVGPITRQVTVATNDPNKPELTFMLTAMVTR